MLRLARIAEAPALAEMSRELIEAGLAWRYTPRRLAALMAERDVLVVVAEAGSAADAAFGSEADRERRSADGIAGGHVGGSGGDGRAGSPQGFAVMQFGDERAHLVLLCVHATQQRLGLGRALHDWLLKSAQVAGMASIALELRADNSTAMAFYRSLGYREVDTVAGYYDGRIAARRMLRHLREGLASARGETPR
jgi:[ribosomal protein S18]-alanine N-acetyltransferase